MTTALELITDALIEIGAHDLGQSVPAEDAQLGLRKLNQLLGRWAQQRLLAPYLTQFNVPLTGAASYTIGPTGTVAALRPLKIERATATKAGVETPVDVLTRDLWDAIGIKSATGQPEAVWYEPTMTNGTIHVYPVASGYTLHLDGLAQLLSFAALTTDVDMPAGYDSAIMLTLASDLCGPFSKAIPQDLQRRAAGAVRAVKRTNAEPLILSIDLAASDRYSIERGY